MLSDISGSYAGLTEEQRESLANLLQVRNEYTQAVIILNQKRIELLRDYTEAGEESLTDFASMVIAPIRRRVTEQTASILNDVVDIEGLKGMLPMVVMALVGNINLPLLFGALGIEPDTAEGIVGLAKDFFKQGM